MIKILSIHRIYKALTTNQNLLILILRRRKMSLCRSIIDLIILLMKTTPKHPSKNGTIGNGKLKTVSPKLIDLMQFWAGKKMMLLLMYPKTTYLLG